MTRDRILSRACPSYAGWIIETAIVQCQQIPRKRRVVDATFGGATHLANPDQRYVTEWRPRMEGTGPQGKKDWSHRPVSPPFQSVPSAGRSRQLSRPPGLTVQVPFARCTISMKYGESPNCAKDLAARNYPYRHRLLLATPPLTFRVHFVSENKTTLIGSQDWKFGHQIWGSR